MANTARRQGVARPATTEELECWAQAAGNLRSFAQMYTSSHGAETTQRVNRLLANWPTDDQGPGPEGMDGLLATKAKLDSGLKDLRKQAQAEAQAIDEALEKLQVLIALRKANESAPINEKRAKRPRAGSSTPTPAPRVSITLPARPTPPTTFGTPYSKDPKVRRDQLIAQLPLQKGRKVAFKTIPEGGVDEEWIVTVVLGMLGGERSRYEVVDMEADAGPKKYEANLKSIIPLPDPNASPDSAASLNTWPVYPVGTSVLGIYPDTTTFYRAIVIATPEQTKLTPRQYKVKFDDDGDEERDVDAYSVVEWRE